MVTTKRKWTEERIDRLRFLCRQARFRNNLQQKDVAERLNWSINTIGNFERGDNTPSPANLDRLADVVNELLNNALVEENLRAGDCSEGKTQGGHCENDANSGVEPMGPGKESAWRLMLKAHRSGRPEVIEELEKLFEQKEQLDAEQERINRSIQAVAKKLQSWTIGLSMIPVLPWLYL